MKMKSKRMVCLLLVFAMALVMSPAAEAQAKKKAALNKKKAVLTVGQSLQLKVKNNKKKVKWSSSKKKVASVSKKGKVKALKAGTSVIKAKIGKKTLKCNITVKKKSGGGSKQVVTTIGSITFLNQYTIQVELSAAQALTVKDFEVKTKVHSTGSYNRTLKIDSMVSGDKKKYILSLNADNPLLEAYHVQVIVKNLKGSGTVSRVQVYNEGVFAYEDTLIYTGMQGSQVSKTMELRGAGYSTCSASGLPSGISYKIDAEGNEVRFTGTPTKAGSFSGKIVTKDELGNTHTYHLTWIIGNDTTVVAAAKPVHAVITAGKNCYVYSAVSVVGGSGSYTYTIEGNNYGLSVKENDGAEVEGNLTISSAGTYTVPVVITDKENPERKTTAKVVLSLVEGRTISGIVKDANGNIMQSAYVSIKNKNKSDRFLTSTYAYTDSKGNYSVTLPDGNYQIYSKYGNTISSIQTLRVSESKSGIDFTLPLYMVTVQSNDIDAGNFGTWKSQDGTSYNSGNKLFLPTGTYTLTSTATAAMIKYTGTIKVTVKASPVTVTAAVTQESLIKGIVTAGEPLQVVLSDSYKYYTFVPDKTGTYSFYSASSLDTYGELRDASGKRIDSDDDSGDKSNFKISYSCTAGTTYYIGIRAYSSSGIGRTAALNVQYEEEE